MKFIININGMIKEEHVEINIRELNSHNNMLISELEKILNTKRYIMSSEKGVKNLLELTNIESFVVRDKIVYAQVGGTSYRLKEKIGQIEEEFLDNDFFKISKSAIINLRYVDSFESAIGTGFIAVMKDGINSHYVAPNYFKKIQNQIKGEKHEK
jgi:DNA-binding LytR/AlgR family response regulator